MSNIIPPMVSSTPPPVDDQVEEDEDDEFSDFRVADALSFGDFNQSNDSTGSPDLWMKPLDLDEETITKTPDKIPNGVFTPLTDEDKQCDSPQHLNVFFQPVSDESSIIEKLPELMNDDEGESNQLDELKSEDGVDDDDDNDDLNSPKAQENIPDELLVEKISISSINDALNPNDGCDINSVNRTEDINNEEFRTSDDFNNNDDVDKQDDCEFSDFADFTSVTVKQEEEEEIVKNDSPVSIPVESSSFNEDDFDDFECADFEPSKEPSLEETLQIMFPQSQEVQEDQEELKVVPSLTECLHSCIDDSTSVWGQLKELETSHALSYQWSNSSANKCLLSSLNIDSRYVLFGSRWNASIPRFAANLGFSPLEPVKASEPPLVPQQPQPQTTNISSDVIEEVVPAAQFDWTSSGLTNPLDCLEKEIISATSTTTEQTTQGTVNKEETIKNDILSPVLQDSSSSSNGQNKIEVETILQNNTSFPTARVKKKEELTPEAFKVVESFPDLSFLSARKLMCTANENMNRWRTRP